MGSVVADLAVLSAVILPLISAAAVLKMHMAAPICPVLMLKVRLYQTISNLAIARPVRI